MSENQSKFVSFTSNSFGINSNVSISIGVTSRVGNQSYMTSFQKGDSLLNCGAYTISGNQSCVRVFQNLNTVEVTTTIRGKDYYFHWICDR